MVSRRENNLPAPLAQRAAERARAAHAEARAEAEAIVLEAKRALEHASEAFFELGEAFAKLRDKRLYSALGFDSFEQLVTEELATSRTHAYNLIAVTEQLQREHAIRLGPAKATALVRLAAVTPRFDTAESLLRARVVRPGRRERVEVGRLSLRELRELIREAIHRRRRPGARVKERERAAALAWATRLREHLESAGVDDARVQIVEHRRGPKEALRVRLEVPFELRARAGKVLSTTR
jgi:hypothetical protein